MSGPEQNRHLDDEAFCALADDALEGPERQRALAHLSTCSDCLAQWAGLLRNLEAAEEEEPIVPKALLTKARSLSPEEPQSRESFWEVLFGMARPWQWGLAWGAATAVLLATLYFSPEMTPSEPAFDPPRLSEPAPVVAQSSIQAQPTPESAQQTPEPTRPKQPAVAQAPVKSSKHSEPADFLDLAKRSLPTDMLREPGLAQGMNEASARSLPSAYEIGRRLAYSQRYAKRLSSGDIRELLADNTGSLALAFQQAQEPKLAEMAADLQRNLKAKDPDQVVLKARLDVLGQAALQWLDADALRSAGACLGRLDQGWHMGKPSQDQLALCRTKLEALGASNPTGARLLPLLDDLAKAKTQQIGPSNRALRKAVHQKP